MRKACLKINANSRALCESFGALTRSRLTELSFSAFIIASSAMQVVRLGIDTITRTIR